MIISVLKSWLRYSLLILRTILSLVKMKLIDPSIFFSFLKIESIKLLSLCRLLRVGLDSKKKNLTFGIEAFRIISKFVSKCNSAKLALHEYSCYEVI